MSWLGRRFIFLTVTHGSAPISENDLPEVGKDAAIVASFLFLEIMLQL